MSGFWRVGARLALLLVLFAGVVAPARAETADERLVRLEQEVAALRAAVEQLQSTAVVPAADATASPLAELSRRIDLLAAELEAMRIGQAAESVEASVDEAVHGFGPAASKVYRKKSGVSIGGYGELLYQKFDSTNDAGAPSGRLDELDALRAVLYFGYKWNEKWLLNTELEWEHGSTGKGGEASIEFAYVDRLIRPEVNVRAGLVLLPVGLVNELHEPTTFLGTRRPGIESAILPTTWRESGVGLFGDVGGFTYRTYVVNGLDARGFTSGGLRGGRQKGANAKAEDFAWVGRLDWTATPGLLVGGSYYLGDSGQGLVDPEGGETLGVSTRLLELHADWKWRGFEARGLWVDASVGEAAGLNRALALTGNKSVGSAMDGHYLQFGYDLFARRDGESRLLPFVRLEQYDTQAEVPVGFERNPVSDVEITTLGLQWQPFEQLVIKGDFQDVDNGAGSGVDQFNLALGWVF